MARWEPTVPLVSFASRAEMTDEVQALRRYHNLSPDNAIAAVAYALRRQILPTDWAGTMAALPEGSVEFWQVPGVDPADLHPRIIGPHLQTASAAVRLRRWSAASPSRAFHPRARKAREGAIVGVPMSFFSKLKDRMFKSSSKLEAGLDAIVEDEDESKNRTEDAAGAPAPKVTEVREAPVPPPPAAPLDPAPASVPAAPAPTAAPPVLPLAAEAESLPPPAPAAPAEPEASPARAGFLARLIGRKPAVEAPRRALDDAMLEEIEELLISADMGVDTAARVTAAMAQGRLGARLTARELKEILAAEIARIMETVARPLPLYGKRPQVVLVVGVNGSGKTTTIGKLAAQFRAAGKSVMIAAGDTFRAAAVEQLQVWGQRAGVPVMTAPQGSDPASLAFDAMARAEAEGADLLLIDTAGRLQNRADLMAELEKIVRVIRKRDPEAPHNTVLVLDATTGQNALSQVEIFQKLADVSGLVMTKLDGTAKGGVLVALADRFGLPIHAIGVGEQIDDLSPFDPEEFAAALTGLGA